MLYNRASADPDGQAVERAQEATCTGTKAKPVKWAGPDIPDFPATKDRRTPAKPGASGIDAHCGQRSRSSCSSTGARRLFVTRHAQGRPPCPRTTSRWNRSCECASTGSRTIRALRNGIAPTMQYNGSGQSPTSPTCLHDLSAHRAVGYHDALRAVARRTAAGAFCRDRSGARRDQGHSQRRVGHRRHETRRDRSARARQRTYAAATPGQRPPRPSGRHSV